MNNQDVLNSLRSCRGRTDTPIHSLEWYYGNNDWCIRFEIVGLCQGRDDIPLSLIERFYEDEEDQVIRIRIVKLCQGRDDIPLSLIERFYEDKDEDVRLEGVKLCHERDDVSISLIERFAEDEDEDVRLEAVKLCKGRTDVSLSLIERFAEDEWWRIRFEAVKLCKGRDDIPLSLIERFYEDKDEDVRLQGVWTVCAGHLNYYQKDSNGHVRNAAKKVKIKPNILSDISKTLSDILETLRTWKDEKSDRKRNNTILHRPIQRAVKCKQCGHFFVTTAWRNNDSNNREYCFCPICKDVVWFDDSQE